MYNKKVLTKERFLELRKEFLTVFNDKSKRPKYYGKNGIYKTGGVLKFKHFMLYALMQGRDLTEICHRTDTHKFRKEVYFNFKYGSFVWSKEVFDSITKEEFEALSECINKKYFEVYVEGLI